jgi:hypothetical protein
MRPAVTEELAPIAVHAARMSSNQVRALRDAIAREITRLEASIVRRQRDFPMHAHDLDIKRDQHRCAVRRRELAYLAQLLLELPP